jgi:hypothetical protein
VLDLVVTTGYIMSDIQVQAQALSIKAVYRISMNFLALDKIGAFGTLGSAPMLCIFGFNPTQM